MNFQNTKYSSEAIYQLINNNQNPVLISFISPNPPNNLITIPVWTYFYEDKFYSFTGKNSLKVKAIKKGMNNFSLIVVDKNSFPDVYRSSMPYISVSGQAKIVSYNDNNSIPEIHIKLLEKYAFKGQPAWMNNLIEKIQQDPQDTWLIEITPEKHYEFNE